MDNFGERADLDVDVIILNVSQVILVTLVRRITRLRLQPRRPTVFLFVVVVKLVFGL